MSRTDRRGKRLNKARAGWPIDMPWRIQESNFTYVEWGKEVDDIVAMDIETNGKPWYSKQCRITVVGVCDGDKTEVYDMGLKSARAEIGRLLGRHDVAIVGHNFGQFDLMYLMLAQVCVSPKGPIHDTISMARVANNLEFKVGLDFLGKKYCGMPKIEIEKPWLLEWDDLVKYCGRDVEITWLLWHHYMNRKDREDWWQTYLMELQLNPGIIEMYQHAFELNYEWCLKFILDARAEIAVKAKHFASINHRSNKQLPAFLYGPEVGLKPSRGQPMKKDGWSTAEAWIVQHFTDKKTTKKQRKILEDLLELRSWEKNLKYVEKLVEFARWDGRVHGSLKPYTAKTGRWSAAKPNLEQIPGKPHFVRNAFMYSDPEFHRLYPKGLETKQRGEWLLWSFDYDQMELRMAAERAGEEVLIKAFEEGRDIHMETAKRVTSGNRDHAKVVIYAWMYGAQVKTMAETLRVVRDHAAQILTNMSTGMPALVKYMGKLKKKMTKEGKHYTPTGRKFRVEAPYQTLDYEIQGSGADILKWALIETVRWLRSSGLKSRVVMVIHDEMVLAILKSEKEKVRRGVKRIMEEVGSRYFTRIPLTVSDGPFLEKS